LVIYLKVIKLHTSRVLDIFNKYIVNNRNKNASFISKLKEFVPESDSINIEIVMFIKLLEYYFFEQYNKDIEDINKSIDCMNVADFINANLFLFESVYDIVEVSYKSFKEKVYWNFGEIVNLAFSNYPKMIKKTLYRHLNYLPSQNSLLYYLILYYYSNKEFRRCKLLIRV
jgi:hypothetical protein